jgi:hypothetical protein
MMSGPRIFADFNDLLGLVDRVRLDTAGAREDLERQEATLEEGMPLVVYDHDENDRGERDDLIAHATAHWDAELGTWVAVVDRATIRNESESAGQ